ncbi:MAG TPA: rhodanese-like domain-containing protein [Dermatophilaceae bacterium]|nr:rhodanese-like domain-containing protein [Dermatophilaceae bacterium]
MITTETRVDAATLEQWLTDGSEVRVLDVRSPAEFEGVHIPGAYNVPLDTLGEHAEDIQRHVDEPVVLVCRSGMRASQAEQRLAGAGMGNVKVLEGGMMAWERTGGKVNRGAARWDIERQVRLVAGSIVATAILASVKYPKARFVAGAVGGGLTFAALSNSCVMGTMLSKLPYNRSDTCDVNAVVDQLTGRV